MLNKKIMILGMFLVSLLAVGVVSATENVTDNVGTIENTNDNVIATDLEINGDLSSDSLKTENMINESNNLNDGEDVLAVSEDEEVSTVNNEEVLSITSPPYYLYSVTVSDTTIPNGKSGTVTIHIDPVSNMNNDYYAYDFNFIVYDTDGNEKISENFYSSTRINEVTNSISANELSSGTYTIKLINYKDGHIMDTAKLTIKAKPKAKITVKSITGKPGKKVKLTATVKDSDGNKIKKCTITFKVNGKKYTAKTNSKGIATLKIKIPKSKRVKISSKTKNKIVTRTTEYKKTYKCTASVSGNKNYKSSSTKFKVTSKKKKTQKYKIVKRQTKKITIPYKKYGLRKKTSGHYAFAIQHQQFEGDIIYIAAGDKILQKTIKFSSKAYSVNNGKKVYIWKNKWMKSKHSDDIHQYFYGGDAEKVYVVIKYNAYKYKKIK